MSNQAGKTKKVTTYGRKKTQIISVHSDFTPDRPTTSSKLSPFIPSPSPVSPVISKISPRPPLRTKLSQDNARYPANISRTAFPPKDEKHAKPPVKGFSTPVKSPSVASARHISSSPESEVFIHRPPPNKFRRARRIVTRSPPEDLASPEPHREVYASPEPEPLEQGVKTRRVSKPQFDGVEIPTRRSRVTSAKSTTSSLVDKFARVTIDLTESDDSFTTAPETSGRSVPVEELLKVCSFPRICPFNGFLSSGTFTNLFPTSRPNPHIRKIGEATYSEVFGVRGGDMEVVVKIVPLECENDAGAKVEDELPDRSTIGDFLKEIETTKHMTRLDGGGFVDFMGAFVVRGPYPANLLDEWDDWDEEVGSESIRPDGFLSSQRYALIVLGDGGPDLEAFKFDKPSGWIQAASIFWQIADSLSRAESWARFEHRDLHEGQVLINTTEVEDQDGPVDYLSRNSCGVHATIIDFGLSRLDSPNEEDGPIWSVMPAEVFEGVGDQWDVYRAMKAQVDDWEAFNPITNVMWLRYLLKYLLHSKGLRKPRVRSMKPAPTLKSPLQPTRRIPSGTRSRNVSGSSKAGKGAASSDPMEAAYEMLHEVEAMFAHNNTKGKKGKSKKGEDVSDDLPFGSAEELVSWGKSRNWIR